jgi:signal transduction histidine kinase
VLGLISLAKNENSKPSIDDYFGLMERSVHKLDDTLKEILDYSRNARSEIRSVKVDLQQLIDEAVGNLKYLAGFNGIDLKMNIREESSFFSDLARMKVIVNNLLSNAIKYSDPTKSKRFIEIDVVSSGQLLVLRFSDNGVGIRRELQPKIFNMFFRANEKSDGAGLGLYIVKEALKKLGGHIEVESDYNIGTTFTLTLPNQSREE